MNKTFLTALVAWAALGVFAARASTQTPDHKGSGPTGSFVDLMTSEGATQFNAQWRYSDVRVVETAAIGPGEPSGFAYDIQPHAGEAGFDDSGWPVIEPKTLGDRRAGGKVSFNWYRINLTMPAKVGNRDTAGARAFLNVTIDDYAEVWVNGQLPRAAGKPSPNAVVGFNTSNRVLLTDAVKPGEKIQIAVFGMNGPISAVPANRVFMREAKVEFVPI